MRESENSIFDAGSCEADTLVEPFFSDVRNGIVQIYNEFSFQPELGIFLRKGFPNKKIQFERSIEYFGFDRSAFVKKEIDISFFSEDKSELLSVFELKYPRNGQHPEQMYSFCRDIVFLEQMVRNGFESAYFVAVVDDQLFYSGNTKGGRGIYAHFRSDHPIEGSIEKPTGATNESITVQGSYHVNWNTIWGKSKYFIVEVNAATSSRTYQGA